MRALGALCLVAACSPPGLTIEVVVDDPAIAKVELFAGRDCDRDCPRGTVAPGLPLLRVDDAYIVDDPAPFVVTKSDFSDGVAGFRIEASPQATLSILVAVGYDAQGQIRSSWYRHGVQIPAGNAERWRVELEPTTAVAPTTDMPAAGTRRAATWPDADGHPACLLLEYWNTSTDATRQLLGPASDFDCDGVPEERECAPWIPNAVGAAPTLATANCVTPELKIDTTAVCAIGGPQCTENPTGPRLACVPLDTNYCVPSAMCQCSGRLDEQACITSLIAGGTANTGAFPFVLCDISVDANGDRCDGSSIQLDLGAVLANTQRMCKDIRLNELDAPLGLFEQYLHVGQGKLVLSSFNAPCRVDVDWQGGTAPLVNYGLIEARIDNGNHVVMPLRINIKPGCDGAVPSACKLLPTAGSAETMFACVGAPTTAPACAPDTVMACEGPRCNGACCGPGERCTPNGCSCAGGAACTGGDTCQVGQPNPDQCGAICCGVTPCPF